MINSPQHYLVVDDDSTNNLICDFTIRKFDRNAIINLFLEPEKALQHIEITYSEKNNFIPTVLFLDINMPTMSGFEFLDEFKRFGLKVQQQFTVYMLSSSIEDFTSQAKKYPIVTGFLSKPLRISNLQDIFSHNSVNKAF